MNKQTIVTVLLALVALAGQAEKYPQPVEVNSTAICETDSSVIDPFYVFETNHAYRIADTQTIPDMGSSQYSVSWYVDTEEWDFNPQTNHIFSKIEFKKGDTVFATFCDDDGWSYIGVENSKAKMFKSFRLDTEHTAVVFRGGIYSDGVSTLTVFVLSGDEVKLVFNKLYSMEKIKKDKIFISADATTLEICGYLSFKDGRISFVSKEYPKGKSSSMEKRKRAGAQEVDATIKEFISSMYETNSSACARPVHSRRTCCGREAALFQQK